MLQESFSTAQQDIQARALVEARVDADRMLLATQSALNADGDLLSDSERAVIDASMAQLREAIKGNEAAAIEAATKTLANDTEAFAAQRMNAGIARALAGRKVESL